MGMLRVLSRRGDEQFLWTCPPEETNDPEALAAVQEAERIFEQERKNGATAFKVEPGQPAQRLETFDRTAQQIVLVPHVVGG
jgi:hypothetical protein